MQQGNIIAEVSGEFPKHLRRERDLGDEDHRVFPVLKRLLDQMQIDLRFAARRYAVQKSGFSLAAFHELL